MSTITEHETKREARLFTERRNAYKAAGLCDTCAAQAAYGHAHGFRQAKQPCIPCMWVVNGFPAKKSNSWRALPLSQNNLSDLTTPTIHTLGKESPRQHVPGLSQPHPWELCYADGGPREGMYEADLAAWRGDTEEAAA